MLFNLYRLFILDLLRPALRHRLCFFLKILVFLSLWYPARVFAQPSLTLTPIDYNGYNISCSGNNDGAIDLLITGGTAPFDILWSNSETTEDISNLAAGNYSVRVIDANSDTAITDIDLIQPDTLVVLLITANETCDLANGSITTILSGGVASYTYLWSNAESDSSINSLIAGSYTVTVTDLNGCTVLDIASITNIPGPIASVISKADVNCFGGNDGSIDLGVTNGTPPFSFLWSNAETNEDIAGLAIGNYVVTVTDSLNCIATTAEDILQPDSMELSFVITDEACDNANGGLTVSVTGGTSPFQYLWSNGSSTQQILNLASANFTVTITDDHVCTQSSAAFVNNIPAPVASVISRTDVNCFGGSDGSIDLGVSNGTPPFSFLWSNAATTEDIVNLFAGNYSVTVTDSLNCISSDNENILQPDSIELSFTIINEACDNASGSLEVLVTGGTPPYQYLWSNNGTNQQVTSLQGGSYTVTVTDDHVCLQADNAIVSNIPGPVANVVSQTDVNCFGGSDGAIFINVLNGTQPFSFLWSNGITTEDILNLTIGSYTVTVTDFNNCTSSTGEIIDQPDSLEIDFDIILSSGLPDGAIHTEIYGGIVPYDYLWSNGATTADITALLPGNYTLTITDAHICTASRNGTVNLLAACDVVVDSTHDVSCNGGSNGEIFITNTGEAPFTYVWSNGETNADISNLIAGTYTVTVTDDIGCVTSTNATIAEPAVLNISFGSTNETCGSSNGSITANVTGGTPSYFYAWSNGGTNATINNIAAGTYTITVTDDNACTIQQAFSILNVTGPSVALDSVDNVLCNGESNGGIFITVSNGTFPYTFLWSNTSANEDLQGVSSGTYTVTVTDNIGCTTTLSATVTQPAVLDASTSSTNEACGNANGTATVTPTGGTTPYSYLWSNGQTTATTVGLVAGNYTVTVTDDNGCTIVRTRTILNLSGPSVILDSAVDVLCFGQTNGKIYITASGGTAPRTFLWSNATTNEDLLNVGTGTYTVTVTDNNGCTASLTAVINQPAVLDGSVSTTNSTCGNGNGSATMTPTGGTSPYSYLWSNTQTGQTATNLIAGNYTVTVTDNNGCTLIRNGTVANSAGPAIAVDSVVNAQCFGDVNGAIYITVTGGTAPLSYLWSDASTNEDLINVVSGTYTVTIADFNNCTASVSRTIAQPSQLNANTSTTPAACGISNGTASVLATGGSFPYTYLWSNSQTSALIILLSSGVYTVTVTDFTGCTKVAFANVNNLNGPTVTEDSLRNVRCFGQVNGGVYISVIGLSPPYTYLWSNGLTTQDLNNVAAGTYTVTVTDNNTCTATLTRTLTEPPQINATATNTSSTCGNANGTANVTVSGGVPGYSYLWTSGQTTASISGLLAATYSVTITDAVGCLKNRTTVVANIPGPTLILDSTIQVRCFGQLNGKIYITKSGGTNPVTYLWSSGITSQDLLNVAAGTYTVTITDNNGCTATLSQTITQPAALDGSVSVSSSTCGNANGSATANPTGGTSPFTYLWSNAQTTQTITNVLAGNYTVTISDINACTVLKTGSITNIAGPSANSDSVISVKCFGQSNGGIYISVLGGTPSFAYLWSNATTNQDLTNVASGTYTVTVTDNNSCTSVLSSVVTQPLVLNASTSSTSASCGNANGTASVSPTGGTPSYSFLWSNAQTNQTISTLSPGIYTVTVTDANGCTVTKIQTVLNTGGPVISLDSIVHVKCFGDASGDVYVGVSGGASPLSFQWSNSSTNEDLINVVAGTYTLIVTDTNSCTDTLIATITQPSQLNDSTTTTNTLCGNSSGTAQVWPYGATGPYTYSWSTTATTQQITGLASGSYTVTITDANNCTKTDIAIVGNIGGPTITVDSIRHVRCFGQSNGAIYITAIGGTTPYSYTWSNGPVTEDNVNIAAGTYTLIVLDANNCLSTATATVTQPTALNDSIQKTNAVCGNANGSATVFPYSGTSPYTFLWSNGFTTQTISNLAAATYTVTITDNNACTKISSVNILNTAGPSVVIDSVRSVKCFGDSTGGVFIHVTGGTPTYTYSWSPGGFITEDITNVPAGNYTVLVTDFNLCTAVGASAVSEPTQLNSTVSTTNTTCSAANGTAAANPTGGLAPYTYQWAPPGNQTTQVITNLAAGTYTVTVTDANSCTVVAQGVVGTTGGATITLDSLFNVSCNGANDGAIYLTIDDGTPPYNILWSPGSYITEDITNLSPNTYNVIVLDGNNCLSQASYNITQPTVLNDSIIVVSETCGLNNGSLTVYPYGGTFPYSLLWSNGFTTQSISNLNAGTYTVTVTDSNGCTEVSSSTVLDLTGPVIAVDSVHHVRCNGDSNGDIFIDVVGGTAPLVYQWTPGGAVTQDLLGVVAGLYTLTVSDFNNCIDSASILITEPDVLSDSINVTDATCGASNGTATVFAYGGTPPYDYIWSAGFQTTQTITNLNSSSYTVTVTDANGCTVVDIANVGNLGGPVVALDSLFNVSCNGVCDGAIYISINGGTPPLIYFWSNSAGSEDIENLCAGTYTITVSDANNCLTIENYTITEPDVLDDSVSVIDATCNASNGEATAYPFGGTPPYDYLWSNAFTTQNISGLSAGTYTVTITDNNGCQQIDSAIVSNAGVAVLEVDSVTNVKCNGGLDGEIFISVTGGLPSFTYLWSNGFTSEDITGVPAGIYTLTVTDANSCSVQISDTIAEPELLQDSISVQNASCNTANGSATVFPYGGTGPYTYEWSTGETTQTINNLFAQAYPITITDSNGCILNDVANVSNINGPILNVDSVIDVSCPGLSDGAIYVSTSSGTPPYTYLWSNSVTLENNINIPTGTYTLTVTDSLNCIAIISEVVSQPGPLLFNGASTPASCGLSDGTASVIPSGGTAPYTYLWDGGSGSSIIINVPAGNYTVTVTDFNNCVYDTTIAIINPDAPVITNAVITDVACYSGSDGEINIDVSGGTTPLDFIWSNFPPAITEDLSGVTAGTYTVIINDASNCTSSATYVINEPPELQLTFTITDATCGISNGQVVANVIGGIIPYTYQWSNSTSDDTLYTVPAGSYTLTVTDANLCTATEIANVNNFSAPVITVVDSGNVSCFGSTDGFISVTIVGVNPISTSWTNTTQTGTSITNLAGNTTYTLTATDANNCVSIRSVFISEPLPISIPGNIPFLNDTFHITCYGLSDGSIDIEPSGGTGPYSFLWSNISFNEDLVNVPADRYTVTVTDAEGCAQSTSFTLYQPPQIISNAGNNFIICGLNADTLHAVEPVYGSGFWYLEPGGAGTIVNPLAATTPVFNLGTGNNTFNWVVSDGVCSDTSQVVVTVNSAIIAIAGADRSLCEDTVVLTATAPQFGYGYWQLDAGSGIISDTSLAQTRVTGLAPGINRFRWTVVNGNCADDDVVSITLLSEEECKDEIQIPTGFTPNGDNKNDVFLIKGIEDYGINSLLIYNRWGNKVFEQSPYLNTWRGINEKGALLPEGTYFYILRVQEIDKTFTGYFDLRR